MADDISLDPKTEVDKGTDSNLDSAPGQVIPIQSQSAKSLLKQQRKQMAASFQAQTATTPPVPMPTPTQAPGQRSILRTRLRTIFSRQKPPQQPTLQAPSGGGVKHGGSFSALNQYTQKLQQSNQPPVPPTPSRKGGGAGLMALGAIGGLAGSAGKKLAPQQSTRQYREDTSGQKGVLGYEKEKTTSDHGYVEKYITIPEIPGARERATDFFDLATRHSELYSFHPFLNEQEKIVFEAFLKNNPDVPLNVLDLKQTWMQYWSQFPEGMKSEREQIQREQELTTPSQTQPTHLSEGILSLAALPAIGAFAAKDRLDPERRHQKQASEIVSKWQKTNPSATLSEGLFVANPDGSLAVNHKLFDQIPELLNHEKSRSFAYKDPNRDPLLQHIRSTANNETEQEIKRQGLTIANDKQKISQIKSGVLEKHYDQFIKDSPHLAEAYKNHPHINAALNRANPSAPPAQAPQPMSRGSRLFQRLRQPQIRYARGTKNQKTQGMAPRRQPNTRRSLFPSLFPSLPGPLGLLGPAKYSSLLLILLLGGLAIFLLFSDVDPVQIDQSNTEEGASGAAGCRTGEGADQGTDLGDTTCEAPTGAPKGTGPIIWSLQSTFSLFTPNIKAYAQTVGSAPDFNPSTDYVYRVRITYPKESKDIIVTYPVPPEAQVVSSSPPPNLSSIQVGEKVDALRWSLKKVLNPGKTDVQLEAITLKPPVDTILKITLRPNPGITDAYIISQAIITLDPLSSDTGGNPDIGENPAPNATTCGGRITINNPDGTNFGDPDCTFTVDKLSAMLKREDPENADYWFSVVIPCESPGYDPNLYYRSGAAGDTPDPSGAWGLFQMGRGLNGQYDHGDVAWPQQIINATTYRRNVSWRYWACAESRW